MCIQTGRRYGCGCCVLNKVLQPCKTNCGIATFEDLERIHDYCFSHETLRREHDAFEILHGRFSTHLDGKDGWYAQELRDQGYLRDQKYYFDLYKSKDKLLMGEAELLATQSAAAKAADAELAASQQPPTTRNEVYNETWKEFVVRKENRIRRPTRDPQQVVKRPRGSSRTAPYPRVQQKGEASHSTETAGIQPPGIARAPSQVSSPAGSAIAQLQRVPTLTDYSLPPSVLSMGNQQPGNQRAPDPGTYSQSTFRSSSPAPRGGTPRPQPTGQQGVTQTYQSSSARQQQTHPSYQGQQMSDTGISREPSGVQYPSGQFTGKAPAAGAPPALRRTGTASSVSSSHSRAASPALGRHSSEYDSEEYSPFVKPVLDVNKGRYLRYPDRQDGPGAA